MKTTIIEALIRHRTLESAIRGGWTGETQLVIRDQHGLIGELYLSESEETFLCLPMPEELRPVVAEIGGRRPAQMGGNWDGLPVGKDGTTVRPIELSPEAWSLLAHAAGGLRRAASDYLARFRSAQAHDLERFGDESRTWGRFTHAKSAMEILAAKTQPWLRLARMGTIKLDPEWSSASRIARRPRPSWRS